VCVSVCVCVCVYACVFVCIHNIYSVCDRLESYIGYRCSWFPMSIYGHKTGRRIKP